MDRLEKTKALTAKRADAAVDISLINQYSMKELTPEEVYCFTARLCDNEVDRDWERFDEAALTSLSQLYLGKTGIFDHMWTAKGQVARLYKTEVVKEDGQTAAGDQRCYLRGYAYMLRNEQTAGLIEEIEAGIKKEISVGCAVSRCICSICGAEQGYCEHQKGQEYNGKLCFFTLKDPTDAYEWSFVAVPAQRCAGVTKSAKDLDGAFSTLMEADLAGQAEKVKALIPRLQATLIDDQERSVRAKIMAENAKFLKK